MKKLGNILYIVIKKIILAFCFIYGFDLIATGINVFIPINILTILVVTLLGFPGLLALIGVYFII